MFLLSQKIYLGFIDIWDNPAKSLSKTSQKQNISVKKNREVKGFKSCSTEMVKLKSSHCGDVQRCCCIEGMFYLQQTSQRQRTDAVRLTSGLSQPVQQQQIILVKKQSICEIDRLGDSLRQFTVRFHQSDNILPIKHLTLTTANCSHPIFFHNQYIYLSLHLYYAVS